VVTDQPNPDDPGGGDNPPSVIDVTSVTPERAEYTIDTKSGSVDINCTVLPANATNKTLTFTAMSPVDMLMTSLTVLQSGNSVLPENMVNIERLSDTSCRVTAVEDGDVRIRCKAHNSVYGDAIVHISNQNIQNQTLNSVTLDSNIMNASITSGEEPYFEVESSLTSITSDSISIQLSDNEGQKIALRPSEIDAVTVTSSDASVLSVDNATIEDGNYKATVNCHGAGTANITVTVTYGDITLTASASATVAQYIASTGLAITGVTNVASVSGNVVTYSQKIVPGQSSVDFMTFNIALDPSGTQDYLGKDAVSGDFSTYNYETKTIEVVIPDTAGTGTITVTAQKPDGTTASYTITTVFEAVEPDGIRVNGANTNATDGFSLGSDEYVTTYGYSLSAVPVYNGTALDTPVVVTTSDSSVATVRTTDNNQFVIYPQSSGSFSVTVTSGNQSVTSETVTARVAVEATGVEAVAGTGCTVDGNKVKVTEKFDDATITTPITFTVEFNPSNSTDKFNENGFAILDGYNEQNGGQFTYTTTVNNTVGGTRTVTVEASNFTSAGHHFLKINTLNPDDTDSGDYVVDIYVETAVGYMQVIQNGYNTAIVDTRESNTGSYSVQAGFTSRLNIRTYKSNGTEDTSGEISAEVLNVTDSHIKLSGVNQAQRWVEINLSYPGEGDVNITCGEHTAYIHFIST